MTRRILFISLAVANLALVEAAYFNYDLCLNNTGEYLYNSTSTVVDHWTFLANNCTSNNSVLLLHVADWEAKQCTDTVMKISDIRIGHLCSLGKGTCFIFSSKIVADPLVVNGCKNVFWMTSDNKFSVKIIFRKNSDHQLLFRMNYKFMELQLIKGEHGQNSEKDTDSAAVAILSVFFALMSIALVIVLARQHWSKIKRTASEIVVRLRTSNISSAQIAPGSNGLREGGADNAVYDDVPEGQTDEIYHEVDINTQREIVENQLYGMT